MQLRNFFVQLENAVQPFHLVLVSLAHAVLMQRSKVLVNSTPQLGFFLAVRNRWNFVMNAILQSDFCDLVPSFTVFWVCELQMIPVDLILDLEQSFPEIVDVKLLFREPRHLDGAREVGMNSDGL